MSVTCHTALQTIFGDQSELLRLLSNAIVNFSSLEYELDITEEFDYNHQKHLAIIVS